ncbi:hypothetical protein ACWDZ5_23700, partial [Streptomyces sp. NPDC002996]
MNRTFPTPLAAVFCLVAGLLLLTAPPRTAWSAVPPAGPAVAAGSTRGTGTALGASTALGAGRATA